MDKVRLSPEETKQSKFALSVEGYGIYRLIPSCLALQAKAALGATGKGTHSEADSKAGRLHTKLRFAVCKMLLKQVSCSTIYAPACAPCI